MGVAIQRLGGALIRAVHQVVERSVGAGEARLSHLRTVSRERPLLEAQLEGVSFFMNPTCNAGRANHLQVDSLRQPLVLIGRRDGGSCVLLRVGHAEVARERRERGRPLARIGRARRRRLGG